MLCLAMNGLTVQNKPRNNETPGGTNSEGFKNSLPGEVDLMQKVWNHPLRPKLYFKATGYGFQALDQQERRRLAFLKGLARVLF